MFSYNLTSYFFLMAYFKFIFLVLIAACAKADANMEHSLNYYRPICPQALSIIRAGVEAAIRKEPRMGASLLRLHFHDCFVNGCDGSILLDDNATFVGEKTAIPNNNSIRGFYVIDDIKAMVENACPGVVSCADVVALAARDSVAYLGGPFWEVRLGRRDSLTASRALANTLIPPPTSNLSALITSFSSQGLSFQDMVALSGAHTIGMARCVSFGGHIYNDSNVNPFFAKSLQQICPINGDKNVLAPTDCHTPYSFDNFYYKNLINKRGLLHSDQVLFDGNSADALVRKYAFDSYSFIKDFARAMVKMSNIKTLTGNQGEIRRNCRKAN